MSCKHGGSQGRLTSAAAGIVRGSPPKVLVCSGDRRYSACKIFCTLTGLLDRLGTVRVRCIRVKILKSRSNKDFENNVEIATWQDEVYT